MNLVLADKIAGELIEVLAPCCESIGVAGSVRRRCAEVKDIELVCVPSVVEDRQGSLFGGEADGAKPSGASCPTTATMRNVLLEKLGEMKKAGTLTDRLSKDNKPAWGERYARCRYHRIVRAHGRGPSKEYRDAYGVAVDLFMVPQAGTPVPPQFGLIYVIRTGDREFSHQLLIALKRATGGGHSEGGVYYDGNGNAIPMPDEASVFAAAGWEFVEPEERNYKSGSVQSVGASERQKELPERKTEETGGTSALPSSEGHEAPVTLDCGNGKHDWSGDFVERREGYRATCARCGAVHPGV